MATKNHFTESLLFTSAAAHDARAAGISLIDVNQDYVDAIRERISQDLDIPRDARPTLYKTRDGLFIIRMLDDVRFGDKKPGVYVANSNLRFIPRPGTEDAPEPEVTDLRKAPPDKSSGAKSPFEQAEYKDKKALQRLGGSVIEITLDSKIPKGGAPEGRVWQQPGLVRGLVFGYGEYIQGMKGAKKFLPLPGNMYSILDGLARELTIQYEIGEHKAFTLHKTKR